MFFILLYRLFILQPVLLRKASVLTMCLYSGEGPFLEF